MAASALFSLAEALAVGLALAYLLLAARENILCWVCALLSTALYSLLFWQVSLLMDALLHIYYMGMAVYGFQQWRYGGRQGSGIKIGRLRPRTHLFIIGGIVLFSAISGYLLGRHTAAAWPYLDSFTTWASLITTVMVARKILENWLYWIVIDSLCIALYIERGLPLTALLFAVYVLIAIFAYQAWRQRLLHD